MMRNLSKPTLLLGAALGLAFTAGSPALGQGGQGRAGMEQCVGRVLQSLARAKAPFTQVGPAIVQQCDKQLRAALAEAIQTGEAGNCTVESCLAVARERAAAEATDAYRQLIARG